MRTASSLTGLMALALLLSACGSLRSKPAATPNTTYEPPTATNPPPATEDKTETAPATPPADSQPAPAPAASTDCVPPPKKPPPTKPKPVRKEAPPPLPTAPAVADTPPGGVVGSEVKAMPVAVMSILGTKVQGPKGEDLGRVVDVLADASGRVRVAIIDFGGFLGVGDRRIAIEWPLLRFNPSDPAPVVLSVDRDKLKTLPDYKGAERPQVLMALPAPTTPPAGDGKQ
jgi:PRC-barrel domain